MHIPDGFLSPSTWLTMSALSAVGVGISLRHSHSELQERDVPALGMMGAFIFAAQMVNFPIAVGTSGHLLGSALATAALGPWAASVVMTAVVLVQALFFHDGGITALGANVFNMALLGPWLAYAVFFVLKPTTKRNKMVSAFCAGWLSTVGTAIAVAVQLSVSGAAPLQLLMPVMLAIHSVIGIVEGIITTATLLYLERAGLTHKWRSRQPERR